jgi:hypothetical protein
MTNVTGRAGLAGFAPLSGKFSPLFQQLAERFREIPTFRNFLLAGLCV